MATEISLQSLADFLSFFFFAMWDMRAARELATKVAFNSRFPETEERGNPRSREKFYPRWCVAAVVLLSTRPEVLQFRVAVTYPTIYCVGKSVSP